jgi:hypothetical protein
MLLTAVFAAILSSTGCIGLPYHVGTKSLFGEDVKTVYVPIFQSDNSRRDLAERLTEAVCKRIEARSPYKVVGRPSADSVLEGKVLLRQQTVSLYNNYADPRQKTGTLSVEVKWKDRRERDLRHFDSIPWNDGSGTVTATENFNPEYGHSELTMEQRQIDVIADQIVGMMENPW